MQTNHKRPFRLQLLEPRLLLAGDIVMTEFMARNDGAHRDGDGVSSDWIELLNASNQAVDLAGYHLTDNANELAKWPFPSRVLGPGETMVVFASGQDRNDYVDAAGHLHTNFSLRGDGEFLGLIAPDNSIASSFGSIDNPYPPQATDLSFGLAQTITLVTPDSEAYHLVPLEDTHDATWTDPAFDAVGAGFSLGRAAVGIEDDPTARTNFSDLIQTELLSGSHAVYERVEFELLDATAITSLTLDLKYDNGFVAYLNGRRVADDNVPPVVGWFSPAPASGQRDSDAREGISIDLADDVDALVNGKNVLAIHVMNFLPDIEDLLLVPRLTAGASNIESATGQPNRQGFMSPTPDAPNVSPEFIFDGHVNDTQFSVDRGYFDQPFQLEISADPMTAEIRYTTDGSVPTETNGPAVFGRY